MSRPARAAPRARRRAAAAAAAPPPRAPRPGAHCEPALSAAAAPRAERAATCVRQACEAGALRFLTARVLRAVPFEDEPPEQQELYAHTLHQLLMLFLDAQPGRCARAAAPTLVQAPARAPGEAGGRAARRDEVGALVGESSALSRERPDAAGALAPAGGGRDALDSLLDALAAVYGAFPDLWLDERLRRAPLSYPNPTRALGSPGAPR